MTHEDWYDDAYCREFDPDTWFPPAGGDSRPAISICNKCEVQVECLEAGLRKVNGRAGLAPIELGVWGGATYNERIRIYRRRQRAARKARRENGNEV